MKDRYTGAIKYDSYERASFISEIRAKIVLGARKKIYRLFISTMNPSLTSKIIDAGVAPVKGIEGAKTFTNNFFESLYPYKENITATSIEDASFLESLYPGLIFVQTAPYKTDFKDCEFDYLFSHAVVEHVGSREKQRMFVEEYCRISKAFFFTTPNKGFFIEPHSMLPLVHWLPPHIYRNILKKLGGTKAGLADENVLNPLNAKDFLSLFPSGTECKLLKIRTLGLTTNLVVIGRWKKSVE